MSPKAKALFILLAGFLFCGAATSDAEVVDRILVVVNDEVVTQGEVDKILTPVYEQYQKAYNGAEFIQMFGNARRNVLARIVHDKLLLSEAKKRKVEVEDKDVEAKIDELRHRFVNEKEFEQALLRENMPLSKLAKRHKERLMIDHLIDTELRRKVSVSPNEVLQYYSSHTEDFKDPQKAKVQSILIRVDENRTEEHALRQARYILSRLREGCDFGSMAKEYSDGPYADSEGDMGWVKEGELMSRINDLVFGLDKNETSCILKTNVGFHIFKVEEKMDARTVKFAKAKNHVEQILFSKKLEEKLKTWIEKLKKDAYIAFR